MDASTVRLEEKVAYLERHVADLDEVIYAMNGRMDHFVREIKQLRALAQAAVRLESDGADGSGKGGDENLEADRPPHW
ncbi:MAG: SlyX family protein [Algisphaera sp.]